MRTRLRRLDPPGPVEASPAPAAAVLPESEYVTVEQLARRWHVDSNTIRRWFKDEPGVLVWGRAESRPGKKRAYMSMRIPLAVAERVRRRMSRV